MMEDCKCNAMVSVIGGKRVKGRWVVVREWKYMLVCFAIGVVVTLFCRWAGKKGW